MVRSFSPIRPAESKKPLVGTSRRSKGEWLGLAGGGGGIPSGPADWLFPDTPTTNNQTSSGSLNGSNRSRGYRITTSEELLLTSMRGMIVFGGTSAPRFYFRVWEDAAETLLWQSPQVDSVNGWTEIPLDEPILLESGKGYTFTWAVDLTVSAGHWDINSPGDFAPLFNDSRFTFNGNVWQNDPNFPSGDLGDTQHGWIDLKLG